MTYHPKEKLKCSLCGKPSVARRLCRLHYNQFHVRGRLNEHPILGPEDVFHSRYVKKDSGCWEWSGGRNDFGYGVIMMPGTNLQTRAHRYSYELHKGPIPKGLVVMHSCDNPPCVNPAHLSLGTKLDNNLDAARKGRRPSGKNHWTYRTGSSSTQRHREKQCGK